MHTSGRNCIFCVVLTPPVDYQNNQTLPTISLSAQTDTWQNFFISVARRVLWEKVFVISIFACLRVIRCYVQFPVM
jgi:hypothetical protein